jgi:hypothetical protein
MAKAALKGNVQAFAGLTDRIEVLVNVSRIKEIRPYFKSSFLLVMSDAASTEIAVSERQARPLRQRCWVSRTL